MRLEGFGFKAEGFGFRVQGLGFKAPCIRCGGLSAGFVTKIEVLEPEAKPAVSGLGFRG